MKKLYIFDRLQGKVESKLLQLLCGDEEEIGELFQKLHTANFKDLAEFTDDISKADAILLPHTYFQVAHNTDYIKRASDFAGEHGIPLILFTTSDYHDTIDIPHSVVLRTAAYQSRLAPNEHVMPALVEDLGVAHGSDPRVKKSNVPSVGFSGMVDLASRTLETKYQLRKVYHWCRKVAGLQTTAEYQGLYYRRKTVKTLESTSSCTTNFFIRKFFSASKATVQGDPDQLRREFISSIQDSDLALVIRGNGNFSLRFFEVLSLGRIPLFIDTDTPLPLEDEIDYDSFMLRVDHRDIHRLPEILDSFWSKTTSEEFVAMQQQARRIFETKLRADIFFKDFLAKVNV